MQFKTIVVRFNPWWFSEQENLTRAFFAEISATLEGKVSEKVLKSLKSVGRRLGGAKDFILAGIDLAPVGVLLRPFAAAALAKLGRDETPGLDGEREKLHNALREGTRRILVIIDDVDRLPSDEARQIFRLVKSVADLPNLIYLLVFDREIARRAVNDGPESGGPDWLEKIVQAPFDLPPAHQLDLNNMFFEGLGRRIGSVEMDDETHWGNMFHAGIAPWLKKPRDVTRLLNVVGVTWPSVAGDLNFADFLAIETMRLFEPRLFAFVRDNKEIFAGVSESRDAPITEALNPYVNIGKLPAAKEALARLFPRVDVGLGTTRYGPEWMDRWDEARRVCSPKRFEVYFTYGVSDDIMSRDELSRAIERLDDRFEFREFVRRLADTPRRSGGTKAAVLLEELNTNVDRIPSKSLATAIESFIDAADLFLTTADEPTTFLSMPKIWEVKALIGALLRKLPVDERVDVLERAIQGSPSLLTISDVMLTLSRQHGRHTVDGKPTVPDDERLLDVTSIDRLEPILLDRIQQEGRDGKLIGRDLIPILFHWAQLSSFDAVNAWTEMTILDEEGALRIAKAATGVNRTHSSGDLVGKSLPSVNKVGLGKLVNVERLRARLKEIETSASVSVEQLEIIRRFESGLDAEEDS